MWHNLITYRARFSHRKGVYSVHCTTELHSFFFLSLSQNQNINKGNNCDISLNRQTCKLFLYKLNISCFFFCWKLKNELVAVRRTVASICCVSHVNQKMIIHLVVGHNVMLFKMQFFNEFQIKWWLFFLTDSWNLSVRWMPFNEWEEENDEKWVKWISRNDERAKRVWKQENWKKE